MAVVPYPLSHVLVKGLRHQIDFYFQRGVQVVRTWPKKSNLIPTPAQAVQRQCFRAIEACIGQQGPQMRAFWQSWQPPVGQVWRDYLHRIWNPPAAAGLLIVVPDFIDIHVQRRQVPQFSTLEIGWDPDVYPNLAPLDIIWTPATNSRKKWKWFVVDHKRQRGKLIVPRWGPVIAPMRRESPKMWETATGRAYYRLTAGVDAVAFAFLNPENPSTEAQMSACIFADVVGPQ